MDPSLTWSASACQAWKNHPPRIQTENPQNTSSIRWSWSCSQQLVGACGPLAKERLQKIQLEQARQKLTQWKDKVSTQHGACRWLKQTEPVSCVLRDNQGNMITDRSTLTQELRTCWSQIFGVNAQSLGVDNFWQTFGPYMSARAPPPVLTKITCADIQQAAPKMSKRATGLDGLAAQHISSLPQPTLIRHWKVVFIPKQKQNSVPKAADVRPISVGPVIYRSWGQIRLRHFRHFLTSALSSHQAGGVGGPDVSSLLLSYDLEFPANEYPCVAALDFTKAFDSCDFDLCLHVMQHLGLPDRILGLLRNQWQEHFRWVAFAGSVHPTPIQGAKGLPQGDPWSPIAMSLVLMLAKRRADESIFALSRWQNHLSAKCSDVATCLGCLERSLWYY